MHHIRGEARAHRRARCCSSTAPACARTSSTARRCRARSSTSSSTEGYDVWLGNWRGSIDLPECDYTLDEVARYDHPALIAAVLRETGAPTLKAVVHCQGSTSFALACAGGLVPEVTDVVSNAVSFHVDVPRLSKLQLQVLVPLLVVRLPGLRPAVDAAPDRAARAAAGHLGAHRAPRVPRARVPDGQLHLRRRRQHPLGPREHRPAHAPLDRARVRLGADHLLPQMSRCAAAGHLVAASAASTSCPTTSWPSAPRNRPRWTFLAGSAQPLLPAPQPGALVRVAGRPGARAPRAGGAARATRTSTSSSAATPSATCSGTSVDALLRGTSNPRGS